MVFPGILVVLCGFSSLLSPIGWNWSYLGFLGIMRKTCGSKCRGEGGGIFLTLCVEFCLVSIKTGWKVDVAKMFLVCKKVIISYNPSSVSYFSYSMEVFLKNDYIWNPVLTWLRSCPVFNGLTHGLHCSCLTPPVAVQTACKRNMTCDSVQHMLHLGWSMQWFSSFGSAPWVPNPHKWTRTRCGC